MTKPTGETLRTEIERRVADMVKRHDVTPVKPEERTELIEVVRRRIKSMAEEYNDDFLRAPRRMLADYVTLERQLSERDAELKECVELLTQVRDHYVGKVASSVVPIIEINALLARLKERP